jgi:hypothetical protein
MSKRDVFAQNIKALTRTRSFQRAIQGWELLQGISLSDVDSPQSCELCNTRFRKGAWVRHPATMGRKQHRIAAREFFRHEDCSKPPPRGQHQASRPIWIVD